MSTRHYAMHAAQANAVVASLYDMDYEQIHKTYGISIEPTGIVYDPTYEREFNSLSEWADWCVANDEYETRESIRHRQYSALT